MTILLFGAGGHAKGVVEILTLGATPPGAYVDPNKANWLDIPQEEDAVDWLARNAGGAIAMGIGGVTTDQLAKRLEVFKALCEKGLAPMTMIHPRACVSPDAVIDEGAIIMANAVIQPCAQIGWGAIINTGAIIEHDSIIGEGSHIAPGAIVLGQCHIGDFCMIGAGSVILPGNKVEDGTLVPAQSRHPK